MTRRLPLRDRVPDMNWTDIYRQLERSRKAMDVQAGNDRKQQEDILRERATSLAKAASSAERSGSPNDFIEVLVFQAGGERYAFETTYVGQVCPMSPITYLPGLPDYVVGIIAVQGQVLSVIDLRSLLDLPLSGITEPEAIVLLRGEAMEFGILAEAILGLERYRVESLQPGLPTLANTEKTYLRGVTMDRTAILDAVQLLSDARLVVDVD